MQLTQDQQKAVQAFVDFVLSDDNMMVISGPAGVGKTALLKYLHRDKQFRAMAEVLGVEWPNTWHFTATTNKAAEVINESMNGSGATTIHSLLGLIVRNDYTTGKTKLTRSGSSTVIHNAVIVIDEASMVDDALLSMVLSCTSNCKIVFIGDHCQLAPVGTAISPVFNLPRRVDLNEVVRSKGAPAITRLCEQLRHTVETGVFFPMEEVEGFIRHLSPEEAAQEIQTRFLEGDGDSRILAFTNNAVQGYNSHVRNLRGMPQEPTPGEVMINNSTVILSPNHRIRTEQVVEILGEAHADTRVFGSFDLPIYRVDTSEGVVEVARSAHDLSQALKHFQKKKDWYTFYQIKERIADFRPRTSSTVHKAQGSTLEHVYINLTDISRCTSNQEVARLLYVAASRATTSVNFIGKLAPRFGA